MHNKFHLDKVLEKFKKVKQDMPKVLANQAQNFFSQTFNKQEWENTSWPEVNRRRPGTKEYKYPKNKGLARRTRAILVKTGRMRREVGNSIREATFNRIRLAVAAPYAEFQNYGTGKIPKRKFMGSSNRLSKLHLELIKKSMRQCFK